MRDEEFESEFQIAYYFNFIKEMSFSIIIIQNEWLICKIDYQVPIWFVFNLSQLLKQSFMYSQKSAAFFPFLKKEFKALNVGFPQLSQDKQMVLRGGTSLQERLWFSKPSIVSELWPQSLPCSFAEKLSRYCLRAPTPPPATSRLETTFVLMAFPLQEMS